MDFHLRIKSRWIFLILFFFGYLVLNSTYEIWYARITVIQAVVRSVPIAAVITLSLFVAFRVLDWLTSKEQRKSMSSNVEDESC